MRSGHGVSRRAAGGDPPPATRLRLIRQLLAENLVLALRGGTCGLLLARLGIGALDWLRPAHLPRQSEIAIDGVVILWTAGLTLMSAVIFGLAPARPPESPDPDSYSCLSAIIGSTFIARRAGR